MVSRTYGNYFRAMDENRPLFDGRSSPAIDQPARLDQLESLRRVLLVYLLWVAYFAPLLKPEELIQFISNAGGRIGYLWQSRWRHEYFNTTPVYLV